MICEYGCEKEALYQLKNGKWCCSDFYTKCSAQRSRNSASNKGKMVPERYNKKKECSFCGKSFSVMGIVTHEKSCYLNPSNKRICPVCGNTIKHKGTETCSNKCKRIYFKDKYQNTRYKIGENSCYTTICFAYNKKECIVCGEDKLVCVHHLDEDRKNNDIKNLIPLCPTHHLYCHSKYKNLIIEKINEHINKF